MTDDRENLQTKAADLVKKVLTVGVGAIFLTEESVRALVSEFKLPKELLTGILSTANKTRQEFLGKLSTDILERVMEKVDPQAMMTDFLEKHEVELNVKIAFKPKKRGGSSRSGDDDEG